MKHSQTELSDIKPAHFLAPLRKNIHVIKTLIFHMTKMRFLIIYYFGSQFIIQMFQLKNECSPSQFDWPVIIFKLSNWIIKMSLQSS